MELIAAAICVVLSVLSVYLFVKYRKLKADYDLMKNRSSGASEELSDFLRDQKEYGYSFVRVDPMSVMIRSPRG